MILCGGFIYFSQKLNLKVCGIKILGCIFRTVQQKASSGLLTAPNFTATEKKFVYQAICGLKPNFSPAQWVISDHSP